MVKRSRANDTDDVPGEFPIPAAHSDQVGAASGQKSPRPEESCEMTPTTQDVSVLLVARVWLVEQMVLQLHRTPEEEECHVSHDNPLVDSELVILEEDWVKHKMDDENFDLKRVAVAKHEELRKLKKLKVYEIVRAEEFERDPEAIKIGTKSVVTRKGTKIKPMIKARLLGKEFADDTQKGELFAGTPGHPSLRSLVSKLATTK